MKNIEALKVLCNHPALFAKFLYERDCNCWECTEYPTECDRNCLPHMLDWLNEECDMNGAHFEVNQALMLARGFTKEEAIKNEESLNRISTLTGKTFFDI